ncbi:hypothetical protein GCM10023174_06440 [Chelativorans composti]|jgi:hypothetical protein
MERHTGLGRQVAMFVFVALVWASFAVTIIQVRKHAPDIGAQASPESFAHASSAADSIGSLSTEGLGGNIR